MSTYVNSRNSTNHAGWVVEELVGGKGWQVVFGPYPDREFVNAYRIRLKEMFRRKEYRVYEAIKEVNK